MLGDEIARPWRRAVINLDRRAYWTIVVTGFASTLLGGTSGADDVDGATSAVAWSFCCSLSASASLSWMRRVSSFCRFGATKVYSPVISRSAWPAIFAASMAGPPTSCHQVMLAAPERVWSGAGEVAALGLGGLVEPVAYARVP